MIADYPHFLGLAGRLAWDAEAIDLSGDAAAWPALPPELRARVLRLVAGFCVGEASVADELAPFAAAADSADATACFAAQARDERRHARFFDRVAADVAGVPGATPAERRAALRDALAPEFLDLFERRLPAAAAALAAGESGLDEAVALYHMVLEGVVFSIGQLALLDALGDELPGLRHGTGLVLRDERWHLGLGARCLQDAAIGAATADRILAEGRAVARTWGVTAAEEHRTAALALLRRRLQAVRRGVPAGV